MDEHRMCVEIMNYVRLNERRWPCLQWFRHWPNEGKRNPWKAKDIGIMSGPSDFFLPVPTENRIGLWLEVKVKGKKPTLAQDKWIRGMRYFGYVAEWVDNLPAAFTIIETYALKATRYLEKRKEQNNENSNF